MGHVDFGPVGENLAGATIVTGLAVGADVFLDGRPHDVAGGAMVAEVNDLDAVTDQFEVDRVDGAVMAIADRHGGKNANCRRHKLLPAT